MLVVSGLCPTPSPPKQTRPYSAAREWQLKEEPANFLWVIFCRLNVGRFDLGVIYRSHKSLSSVSTDNGAMTFGPLSLLPPMAEQSLALSYVSLTSVLSTTWLQHPLPKFTLGGQWGGSLPTPPTCLCFICLLSVPSGSVLLIMSATVMQWPKELMDSRTDRRSKCNSAFQMC